MVMSLLLVLQLVHLLVRCAVLTTNKSLVIGVLKLQALTQYSAERLRPCRKLLRQKHVVNYAGDDGIRRIPGRGYSTAWQG